MTRRAALGAGLALALPAAAAARSRGGDLDGLLALEQRLAAAYEAALERDAIERALGETLLSHERAHIRGLELSIRGREQATVTPPELGRSLESRAAFARYAIGLESETVAAYQAFLAAGASERLLQPFGSIMASGAQHVVALRKVANEPLIPLA